MFQFICNENDCKVDLDFMFQLWIVRWARCGSRTRAILFFVMQMESGWNMSPGDDWLWLSWRTLRTKAFPHYWWIEQQDLDFMHGFWMSCQHNEHWLDDKYLWSWCGKKMLTWCWSMFLVICVVMYRLALYWGVIIVWSSWCQFCKHHFQDQIMS